MKEFNKMDKHFNDLAQNQEQNPPAFIWDQIEQELPKKKTKNRAIWFLLVGFLVSGVVGYFLISSNTNQQVFSSKVNEIKERNLNGNNEVQTNESIETTQSEEALLKKTPEEFLDAPGGLERFEPKENSIQNNDHVDIEKKINPIIEKNNVPHSFQDNATFKNALPLQKRSLQEESSPRSNNYVEQNDFNVPSGRKIIANDRDQNNKFPKEKNRPTRGELEKISLLTSFVHFLPESLEGQSSDLKMNVGKPIVLDMNDEFVEKKKVFLEVSVLGGLHTTGLDKNDPALISFRKPTETNWYTWGISTDVGYSLNKNIYVKTGLQYIVSRDKFYFEKTNFVLEETAASTESLFRVSDAKYFNKGDITYQQFNIPVTLGGELSKGKFKLGLELTTLFNFKFLSEGKIRTGEFAFSRVEDEGTYKNNLGLGIRSAFVIGREISDKGTVFVKPTWSRYLSNTNRETNAINTTMSQYYLEFTYRLNF